MHDAGLNNVDNSMLYTGDVDGNGIQDKIEVWTGSESTNEDGYIRVVLNDKGLDLVRFPSCTKTAEFFIPKLVVGDINNDGKDEIVLVHRNEMRTYALNTSKAGLTLIKTHAYSGDGAWRFLSDSYFYTASLSNVNNDEFLDLLIIPHIKNKHEFGSNSSYDTYSPYLAEVFYGSSEGLSNLSQKSLIYGGAYDIKSATMLGDFNADGKFDILTSSWDINYTSTSINNVTVKESSSLKNYIFFDPLIGPIRSLIAKCYSLDYNNDGLTDLLVQYNDNKNCPTKWGWYILKNKGDYFSESERIFVSFNGSNSVNEKDARYEAFPIDYNGDGYVDVILGDEVFSKGTYRYTNWYFYKNGNGSFSSDGTYRTTARLSKMNAVNMDINNDGVMDLVFGAGSSYMAFTIPNASSRFMVKSVTDGMGLKDEFIYKTTSNQAETPCPASVRNLKTPIMVVSGHMTKDGGTTFYKYGVPKIHTRGKGFLGFESISTYSPRMNYKTISKYEIEPKVFRAMLQSQEVIELNTEKNISSISQINSFKDGNESIYPVLKGKNGENRYVPIITSYNKRDYIKGVTEMTNNLQFDADWNVTKQEITLGDAKKVVETKYIVREGGNVRYLPEWITVTQKRPEQPDIITKTYISNYNKFGQPLEKKLYPDTDGEIVTTYTYYPTGNIHTNTVTPKDCSPQSVEYRYDPYFRLPTSQKNTLMQESTMTYDFSNGNVETTKDVDGFITTYKYDSQGRLRCEIKPNGEELDYKTTWDNSHGAAFKKEIKTKQINHTTTTYYNQLGREIYSTQTGWKGKLLIARKEYNEKGELTKSVVPHFADELEKYTAYAYDDILGRVTKEDVYDGIQVLSTTYHYSGNTTTVTPPDPSQKTTSQTDAQGLVAVKTDAGGSITYKYDAAGKVRFITSNGSTTEIQYDDYGNKHKLIDPDAGTTTYFYYADGSIKAQINAKGDSVKFIYDAFGRLDTKIEKDKKTETIREVKYSYVQQGYGLGQVETITMKVNGAIVHSQSLTFNDKHLQETSVDRYDNQVIKFSHTYDNLWRPETTTSPSGLITRNKYDEYGYIDKVEVGNTVVWSGNDQNSAGQWKRYTLGNGLQVDKVYSARNELTDIKTGVNGENGNNASIQNLSYSYYPLTGNLETRKDLLSNRNETFTYDGLDRLLTGEMTGSAAYGWSMNYHPNGNIDTKSDVGTYQYATPRPHAMSGISNVQDGVSGEKQYIEYTPFHKISSIKQGLDPALITKQYDIYYGLDEQRIKTIFTDESNIPKVKYYFGSYERTIQNNVIQEVDYIITPAGLTAMRMYNDAEGLEKIYYLHTDNLGSIQAVTDENKNTICSYYYTPWGGRVLLSGVNITDRGYTFHEHLEAFGLINMNGRVYDPVLARFLSPDPYVQAPDYTQGFNRYAYCYNNPFKYIDPSGELQIGPFYISLNVGWGYGSGFYFGISAGVGLEGGAYAGISIGYNTSGSFTFSGSIGVAGFYATGGFDTNGGWFAGAGWSALLPSFGIVSFNTNLTSFGVNYSQNSGWSGNCMGMQISKNGVSFSPSVGVSTTLKWGEQHEEQLAKDGNDLTYNEDIKKKFPYKNDEEVNKMVSKYIDLDENRIDKISAFDEGTSTAVGAVDKFSNYFRGEDGYIYRVTKGNLVRIYGVTTYHYRGWLNTSSILLSQIRNQYVFTNTINHEVTHAYINANYRASWKGSAKGFKQFTEMSAYTAGNASIPAEFFSGIYRIITPPRLIPTYLFWNRH